MFHLRFPIHTNAAAVRAERQAVAPVIDRPVTEIIETQHGKTFIVKSKPDAQAPWRKWYVRNPLVPSPAEERMSDEELAELTVEQRASNFLEFFDHQAVKIEKGGPRYHIMGAQTERGYFIAINAIDDSEMDQRLGY